MRNLLVCGRAIGGDRIAHAATRNMACCAVAGQGAGVAAALSSPPTGATSTGSTSVACRPSEFHMAKLQSVTDAIVA